MLDKLIGPVAGLLDKFIEDKDQKNALSHEIATMASRFAQEQAIAQIELNKVEAGGNWFQSSWRPAIGHVCWMGLAYNVLISQLLSIWFTVPPIQTDLLYPIMLGMLGMSGIRATEKIKKVAK